VLAFYTFAGFISDPLREQLAASHLEVPIDDKPIKVRTSDFHQETLTIDIPPGLGNPRLEVGREDQQRTLTESRAREPAERVLDLIRGA
jgi:hypothetical protein